MLEAQQHCTIKIAVWQDIVHSTLQEKKLNLPFRALKSGKLFLAKCSKMKNTTTINKSTSHNWHVALACISDFKSCISCAPITILEPNTCMRSHAGRAPSVKYVGFQHNTTKVLLQHDWASVLLRMPGRDFEQWERGLRLSDKPQGKHISFSSYCLSLCCIVLRSSTISCHLTPLSHRNPANVVTY